MRSRPRDVQGHRRTTRSTAPAAGSSPTTTSTCSPTSTRSGATSPSRSRSPTSGATRSRTRPTIDGETIYLEQQADCFAGAWVRWVDDGNSNAPVPPPRQPRHRARWLPRLPRPAGQRPDRRGGARQRLRPHRRVPGRLRRRRAGVRRLRRAPADHRRDPVLVGRGGRDRGRRALRGHLPARPSTTSASTGRACCAASRPSTTSSS